MARALTHRLGRRFTEPAAGHGDAERVTGLKAGHPALREMRTIFPSMVAHPSERLVLISGKEQRKIGDRIVKGPWAGLRVYCLTLEERATCPASCHHLSDCYLNAMPYARRHAHGHALEAAVMTEVDYLCRKHPGGIAVRLHIGGDFYAVRYVLTWRMLLQCYPRLRLFGFTARRSDDPIGAAVDDLNAAFPARCRIRRSLPRATGAPGETITLHGRAGDRPAAGAGDAHGRSPADLAAVIPCPAQMRPGVSCGSCGLCWSPSAWHRPIGFRLHGMVRRTGSGAPEPEARRTAAEPIAPRIAAAAPQPGPQTDRRRRQPWPVEKRAALTQAWGDYALGVQEIAERFGISIVQLYARVAELGLPPRPKGRRSPAVWARFKLRIPPAAIDLPTLQLTPIPIVQPQHQEVI